MTEDHPPGSTWQRVEALFHRALELDPAKRRAFLDRETTDDAVKHQVEALLRADEAEADPMASALAKLIQLADDRANDQAAAESMTRSAELAEGQHLGPYRLLRVIGRGGLGTVYAAERADGQFERTVAVKVVRRHLVSADLLADLRRERQILARFEHPHIARLYDGGEDASGRPFLAMELVEGEPIDRYCQRLALHLKSRLRLMLDVCGAVAHAHRNLVIHRDLKPSNVLVTGDGAPKLLDFGIAMPLARAQADGVAPQAFTPDFASPEQVAGKPLSTASDVYSLGVILYRLVSGVAPYRLGDERDLAALEQRLRRGAEDPPSVAARRAGDPSWQDLRPDLDAIVGRAMAASPEDRYASVDQLADEIRRLLDDLPVSAVGGSWTYRAGKFFRRHRLAVTAAAITLVALAGGLAATTWALLQARQARAVAESHLDELRREQRRSVSMIESFVDTFRLADPGEARGETISVRELVDRSVAALPETAGATDPELSARLAATFGEIYLNLGAPERAEAAFDRALQRRSDDESSSRDPFHWRTRARLAEAQIDLGRVSDAADALHAAIREHRRTVGHEGVGLARLVHMLGVARLELADAPAAAVLFRQAIQLFDSAPSANEHRVEAMESRHRLAQALVDNGSLAAAEELLQAVRAFRRSNLGGDHPTTVTAVGDLAAIALYRGDNERAARLFEHVLERHRAVFGDEHPHVAVALHNLAVAQRRLGRHDAARRNLVDVVAIRRQLHGPAHPAVADALYGLARFEHQSLDFDRAEPLYREAHAIREQHFGTTHPQTAMALLGVADLASSRDRAGEAESLYREVLSQLDAAGRGESLDASFPNLRLGQLLQRQGRPTEACRWLDRAAAIRRQLLEATHPLRRATEESAAPCRDLREGLPAADTSDRRPAAPS